MAEKTTVSDSRATVLARIIFFTFLVAAVVVAADAFARDIGKYNDIIT